MYKYIGGSGENRMKNGRAWVGIVFCFVVALMLGIPSFRDYRQLKTATKLSTLDVSDYKEGKMVRGTASIIFDCYVSEWNDDKETYRWYLIPINEEDIEYKYVGVKVHSKLFNDYDAVWESTLSYWNGDTDGLTKSITFQGRLKKVDGEVKTNLDKYITKNNWDDYKDYFLPYYIELKTTKMSITNMIVSAVFLGLGFLLLLIAVVKSKGDKKFEAAAEKNFAATPWNQGISLVIDDKELERIAFTGDVYDAEAAKADASQAEAAQTDAETAASEQPEQPDQNSDNI